MTSSLLIVDVESLCWMFGWWRLLCWDEAVCLLTVLSFRTSWSLIGNSCFCSTIHRQFAPLLLNNHSCFVFVFVYILYLYLCIYICGWKYVVFCGGDIKWKWNSECSHCFTEASPPLPSEIWKPWAPPCPVKPFWLNVKNCPKMMIHSAAKGHRNFLCPYFKWLWVCSAINSYQSVCLAKCAMLYFLQKYIIIWNAKLLQTGTVSINKESSPSHARSTLVYLGLPMLGLSFSTLVYTSIGLPVPRRKRSLLPA